MRITVLIIFLLLGLSSCDRNRIMDENVEIKSSGWAISEPQEFAFNIIDTLSPYNLYINVRNDNEYPYRNLYLFVEMTSPSEQYFADTIEIQLADSRGKWMGSGAGNIWMNQVPLIEKVRLLESGEYKIKLIQGMRHDTLKSITDVGFRVELAE